MLHLRLPTLCVMHAIGDQHLSVCKLRFTRLILPCCRFTRLIWLIPLPDEWSWLPTWCPGVHPDPYKDARGRSSHMWVRVQCPAQSLQQARHLHLQRRDSASRLEDLLHQLHLCCQQWQKIRLSQRIVMLLILVALNE